MRPDRRSFCATLATALGAGLLGCRARPDAPGARADTAADTPTSARAAGGVGPLGVQLYTVRAAMQQDFEGTLARLAAIGFAEVEFAGYFGRDPRAVRATLDRVGLRAPSAHVPIADVRTRLPQVLDAARVVGHEWVVVPWLDAAERGKTADTWRRLADELTAAGRRVREAGMRLAYHNHDFELQPVDGQLPLELLLRGTDPALVDFELDLYWATFAGQDPLEWFARHPGRFAMLHLKDSAGPPDHRMTAVGAGRIDFARILARRGEAGTRHVFVEHDEPADAFASVRASHDHLARLAVPAAG
ncbi:MAG TPA: sugar phosphate isomerase/epimerase [Gemmatirosa sp.]|nr:sugar phosphate isomerase/epimerase [Gemmatirosa sp.]